jgi:hypothetical protein
MVLCNSFELHLILIYSWKMLLLTQFILLANSALWITAFSVNAYSNVDLIVAIQERYYSPCVFVIHDGKYRTVFRTYNFNILSM